MVDQVLSLPADTRLMILSPLVVGRKGEQHELFEDLRAQGFVRLRIDGEVHELDAMPKLAKNKKHTIEVVVDRLKVRPDAKQRLAESFETALRHSDGRALAVEMDCGPRTPLLGALRLPGVQLLAARAGAAPVLVQHPDGRLPALRRPGPGELLRPQARRRLPALCRSPPARSRAGTGATSSTSRCCRPWRSTTASTSRRRSRDLPARDPGHPAARLGAREDPASSTAASAARRHTREHPFEGIIPNLERRYRETDSPVVREELAQVPQHAALPGVRRHAPAPRSAPRVRRRPHDLRLEPAAA